jgi:LacI family transcriptional regulator
VALPLDLMGERVMELAVRESAARSRVERIAGEVVLRASTSPPSL